METQELLLKYSNGNNKFLINDLSLNTLYYIGSKTNRDKTHEFIKNLTLNNPMFEVYFLKKDDLKEIYNYMDKNKNTDFEDLLQYISAKNSRCGLVVINDKNFPKIDISLKRTTPKIEDYNFMIK